MLRSRPALLIGAGAVSPPSPRKRSEQPEEIEEIEKTEETEGMGVLDRLKRSSQPKH